MEDHGFFMLHVTAISCRFPNFLATRSVFKCKSANWEFWATAFRAHEFPAPKSVTVRSLFWGGGYGWPSYR